jgi:Lipopolysaccharide-assembly
MSRYLSLALLAVFFAPLQADEPICRSKGGPGCSGCCCETAQSPGSAKPGPKVASPDPCAELIGIMQTTTDADTFLMAAFALSGLGDEGRRALPAVVHNAARLGLLKGFATGEPTPAQQALIECVQLGSAWNSASAPVPVSYPPVREQERSCPSRAVPAGAAKCPVPEGPAAGGAGAGLDEAGTEPASRTTTAHHTVRVPIFKNNTFSQGLEFDLTKAVVNEIEAKTPYKVVAGDQDADTELTGKITSASKEVISRKQRPEISQAETTLTVELTWRDLKTGEDLSRKRKDSPVLHRQITGAVALSRTRPSSATAESPAGPSPVVVTTTLAPFIPELGESSVRAYQQAVKRLATQIVSLLEEPW